MNLVWGTVNALDDEGCSVVVDGRAGISHAIIYPDLTGPIGIGDRVLLNTTAIDLDLGTGGDHFVITRVAQGETPEGIAVAEPSGGHLMKLRYSPLQRDVLAVEAPESPTHAIMEKASSLEGVPVVCCGLHSQVPIVAATVKALSPHLRVGYVMTDEAALHLGYSRVIRQCVEAGLIDTTITVGQAIGGQREAINLYSGLLAACHVEGCEVIIVSIGPGVAGTATPFGHAGIAQGEAINAAASLDGRPIAVLRVSGADERPRHRGISHHTLTVLAVIARASAIIAVPHVADSDLAVLMEQQLDALDGAFDHQGVFFDEPVFDQAHLRAITVKTMGRTVADDPAFFEAAAAAGFVAAQIGEAASQQAFSDFYATIEESKRASADNPTDPDCEPSACASCQLSCPSAPSEDPNATSREHDASMDSGDDPGGLDGPSTHA